MRSDRTRVLSTVIKGDDGRWEWTTTFTPGDDSPKTSESGKADNRRAALTAAVEAAARLIGAERSTSR